MNDTRTQIKTIVDELLSKDWLTTSDIIVLRSFLYVSEDALEATLALLMEMQNSLKEIETTYALEERKVLDEYMVQVTDITRQADKFSRAAEEDFSNASEAHHEEELLNQLTNL